MFLLEECLDADWRDTFLGSAKYFLGIYFASKGVEYVLSTTFYLGSTIKFL